MLSFWKDFLGCPGSSAVEVNVNCLEEKKLKNIFLLGWWGSQDCFSSHFLLQHQDVTAKMLLHLQHFLLKHKVGLVSPCTCAQCLQVCDELCQLLLVPTSFLGIFSIILLILKGVLYCHTGKLFHHLQKWKKLLEISQINFWDYKSS